MRLKSELNKLIVEQHQEDLRKDPAQHMSEVRP